jgi:hypothetical protein
MKLSSQPPTYQLYAPLAYWQLTEIIFDPVPDRIAPAFDGDWVALFTVILAPTMPLAHEGRLAIATFPGIMGSPVIPRPLEFSDIQFVNELDDLH